MLAIHCVQTTKKSYENEKKQNKGSFMDVLMCVVAGQIAFNSFCLHSSVGEQRDFYVASAFANTEVDVFQLLENKTQPVKSQLFCFYVCVANKKDSF